MICIKSKICITWLYFFLLKQPLYSPGCPFLIRWCLIRGLKTAGPYNYSFKSLIWSYTKLLFSAVQRTPPSFQNSLTRCTTICQTTPPPLNARRRTMFCLVTDHVHVIVSPCSRRLCGWGHDCRCCVLEVLWNSLFVYLVLGVVFNPYVPVEQPKKLCLQEVHLLQLNATHVCYEVVAKEDVIVKLRSDQSGCKDQPIFQKNKYFNSGVSEGSEWTPSNLC